MCTTCAQIQMKNSCFLILLLVLTAAISTATKSKNKERNDFGSTRFWFFPEERKTQTWGLTNENVTWTKKTSHARQATVARKANGSIRVKGKPQEELDTMQLYKRTRSKILLSKIEEEKTPIENWGGKASSRGFNILQYAWLVVHDILRYVGC